MIDGSLSFTQGLLIGQLSVVLLIGAFIKFFIFGEAPVPPRGHSRGVAHLRSSSINNIDLSSSSSRSLREKPSTSNVLRPVSSSSTNTRSILRKTYYNAIPTNPSAKHGRNRMNHSTHQPESLDWFNVLIAQTIAQYRQTAYHLKDSPASSIIDSLTAALNNPEKKPSFIDIINVTDVSLGEEFPIFSNCRVIAMDDPNSDGGRLQALMDVDLSDDNLSLAIETSLVLNYPKPQSAILPVALSISVVRFSGTLCISLIPSATPTPHASSLSPSPPSAQPGLTTKISSPERTADGNRSSGDSQSESTTKSPSNDVSKPSLAFSFLPDYRLDLSVRSLVGSRSRLQDVPKVAQLVEARVHAWFEERVVEPRVQVMGLPDFWPRMGRTGVRPGEDAEAGAAAASRMARPPTVEIPTQPDDQERVSERDAEGLRYQGETGLEVDRGGISRSSGADASIGGLENHSVLRNTRSDSPSRHLPMPGAMPSGVHVR